MSAPHLPQPLTERDYAILSTLHAYDGVLAVDQIRRWFFGDARNTRRRLRFLAQRDYLARLSREQRYRVPQPIVWLTPAGAQQVAEREEVAWADFAWRATPRWSKIAHDLLVNEFRYQMAQATSTHPYFQLECWYGQDAVAQLFPEPTLFLNHRHHRQQRLVQPDSFLTLAVHSPRLHRMHFCVELDNGTESNSRFARDKVYPAVQFVHTRHYRTALNTSIPARFLVVVNGSVARLNHLRQSVTAAGGAPWFFFTHTSQVSAETALTAPIWQLAHLERSFSLDEYDTDDFQQFLRASLRGTPTLKLL